MSTASLIADLKAWLNNDPNRVALITEVTPIAETTLKATLNGRYNPGRLLERALRDVMREHPLNQEKAAV